MTSEFAVEMRDVVKKFITPEGNEMAAVDHVTMQIRNGEFFSMLGSSGCGKTTSLRMVAGFEWPTEGEVYIEGKAMGHTPPFQRKVNTVFQSYALFQHMTVFQNLAFGLEMEGAKEDEIKKRVGRALEMVQLTGMDRRKPKQLSGGQQQRVALARALVKTPDVLLLDEPLGALDLKLRKEMQLELKALQQQLGITFIYVTHDQEEALTMSDRIAVMSKGKVQQMGTPVEIYERPSNKFVADFIGESNFLEGKIKSISGNEASVFISSLNAELVGMTISGGFVKGEEVNVCIRPEKIHIAEKAAVNQNMFRATVTNTVYIGVDTKVFVDAHGAKLKVWEQNRISRLDPKSFYTVGQEVWLMLMPENTLVLKKGLAMLQRLRESKSAQGTFLALPTTIWLFVLLIIPLILTLIVSFGRRTPDGGVIYTFTLDNYTRLFGYSTNCPAGQTSCFDPLYVNILGRSLSLAFNTTFFVIALAYPLAYFIARAHPKQRNLYLFMVLIPLWTNFVIRVYAWMMLLRKEGAINIILGWVMNFLHIPFTPLEMLYTPGAVLVGMVYEFLPFMILPIYTSLEKIETPLYEAAADLGANAVKTFLRVTLPLSMPGVVAGTILVFIPVMGTFIVSDILGGRQVILVGNLIQRQFLDARDPTFGSAASLILMVMTLIVTYFYTRKFGFGEEIVVA